MRLLLSLPLLIYPRDSRKHPFYRRLLNNVVSYELCFLQNPSLDSRRFGSCRKVVLFRNLKRKCSTESKSRSTFTFTQTKGFALLVPYTRTTRPLSNQTDWFVVVVVVVFVVFVFLSHRRRMQIRGLRCRCRRRWRCQWRRKVYADDPSNHAFQTNSFSLLNSYER